MLTLQEIEKLAQDVAKLREEVAQNSVETKKQNGRIKMLEDYVLQHDEEIKGLMKDVSISLRTATSTMDLLVSALSKKAPPSTPGPVDEAPDSAA